MDLPPACVWLDGDGTVLHLNEPAEDLFGVSRNTAGGRSLKELLRNNAELETLRRAGACRGRAMLPP